jgi:hypothetical protein
MEELKMNRHSSHSQSWMVWAALLLLLIPVLALAQSPHQRIYIGTYQAPQDNGEFALIVNDQGLGMLAAQYQVLEDHAASIEKDLGAPDPQVPNQ